MFKQFPKKLSNVTTTTKDGYSLYLRRNKSRTVEVAVMKIDDRWVVLQGGLAHRDTVKRPGGPVGQWPDD